MQRKSEIEEFLQDAKRDWETKHKKFYYYVHNVDREFHYDKAKYQRLVSELEERNYSVLDPIMAGWIQGIIDALEWVLEIPDAELTLNNMYPKERYQKFMQSIPVKEE